MYDLFKEIFLKGGIGHSIYIIMGIAVGSWVFENICQALNKNQWANFVKVTSYFLGTITVLGLGVKLVKDALDLLGFK